MRQAVEINPIQRQAVADYFSLLAKNLSALIATDIDFDLTFLNEHFLLRPSMVQSDGVSALLECEGRVFDAGGNQNRINLKHQVAAPALEMSCQFIIEDGHLADGTVWHADLSLAVGTLHFGCDAKLAVDGLKPILMFKVRGSVEDVEFEGKIDNPISENYWQQYRDNAVVALLSWFAVRDDPGLMNTLLQPLMLRQIAPDGRRDWQPFRDSRLSQMLMQAVDFIE